MLSGRRFLHVIIDLAVIVFSGSAMHRVVLLVGSLGLIGASAAAQSDRLSRRFEAANEAYAEDRYEQAVDDYRSVLDAGYASAALYHNLGNAYVRLDSTGPAVWAYEKARRLRPDDARLRHNLEHVRRRAGLPIQGLPSRGLAALVAGWSPLLLLVAGALALGVGLLGVLFKAKWNRHLRGPSSIPWILVGAGLLFSVLAMGTSYIQAHEQRAVVLKADVPLRAAPDEAAASDTTLPSGAVLEIQARRTEWVQVRLRDRTVGWMLGSSLGEV